MDAVLLSVCRCVELEKSELNGALRKGGVEVKHVVPAVVVVLASAVVGSVASVPDIRKGRHRFWLALVEEAEKIGINCPAVAVHAAAVEAQGVSQEVFVTCHDVCQVAEGLRGVAVCSNVDVHPAAAGGVALRARLAEPSAKLLQSFDVLVAEDRGNQLGLLGVRSRDADVLLEFPLAAVCVPCAPGAVAVAAGGVFPASGAEVFGGKLGSGLAGNAVHLNLDPNGLVFHLADLAGGALVHGLCLLESP